MTQDEIIHMAREAGLIRQRGNLDIVKHSITQIERFAALVSAHECKRCDELDSELAKYTEPEPVAWGWATADGEIVDCICPAQHDITEGYYTIPLYTQPVRTKDLSDDEIADALYGKGRWRLGVHPDHLREYRRVIQADRELNK